MGKSTRSPHRVTVQLLDDLRSEMARQHVGPSELARRADLNRVYVHCVARGRNVPGLDWVVRAFEALGWEIGLFEPGEETNGEKPDRTS